MIVAGFDSRVDVFLEQSLLQSELFFNLCCFVSTNLFIARSKQCRTWPAWIGKSFTRRSRGIDVFTAEFCLGFRHLLHVPFDVSNRPPMLLRTRYGKDLCGSHSFRCIPSAFTRFIVCECEFETARTGLDDSPMFWHKCFQLFRIANRSWKPAMSER